MTAERKRLGILAKERERKKESGLEFLDKTQDRGHFVVPELSSKGSAV